MLIDQNYIERRLSGKLPGLDAQLKMAPSFRASEISSIGDNIEKARKSAVMILIFNENDESRIVLMKRSEYDGVHSGQISFPGGRCEESDKSDEFTAQRETFEEIGVRPEDYQVIGQLTDLFIPPSNFIVKVFVGFCKMPPLFNLDPVEVQLVIKVRLDDLFTASNIKSKAFVASSSGKKKKAPYFHVEGEEIWGATAMILSELLEVIKPDNN